MLKKQIFFFSVYKNLFSLEDAVQLSVYYKEAFWKDPPGIENMKEQGCIKKLWHRNQDRL